MSEEVRYASVALVGAAAGAAAFAAAGAVVLAAQGALTVNRQLGAASRWMGRREREEALIKGLRDQLDALERKNRPLLDRLGETGSQVLRVKAMGAALTQAPCLSTIADIEQGDELREICERAELWHRALVRRGTGDRSLLLEAKRAEARLRTIAESANRKLVIAESRVLRETITGALRARGYQLSERAGAVRAVKGATCIWMEVDAHAAVSLDVSGFSGLSCLTEVQALESELARRGLVLRREHSRTHGRPEGGSLVQRLEEAHTQGIPAVQPPPGMRTAADNKGRRQSPRKRVRNTEIVRS